eukprot:scaffold2450_cov401-Prasinococcus_capsulatus_cf.AAC.2
MTPRRRDALVLLFSILLAPVVQATQLLLDFFNSNLVENNLGGVGPDGMPVHISANHRPFAPPPGGH